MLGRWLPGGVVVARKQGFKRYEHIGLKGGGDRYDWLIPAERFYMAIGYEI